MFFASRASVLKEWNNTPKIQTLRVRGCVITFAAAKMVIYMGIKHHLLMAAVAVAAQASVPLRAAEGADVRHGQHLSISGGPMVGANVSGFFHSGVSDGRSRMNTGFSAGGFINLGITRSFSVQGELLFHYKTSDFDWGGLPGEFRYWGVEVPVYAMYHVNFGNGSRLSIGIGPYTEFGLDATYERDGVKGDLYEKDAESGLPILRDSNTGFGVKVGYEFASGLGINVSYKASVTNLLDANSNTVEMRPQAVSVGMAYRFGK